MARINKKNVKKRKIKNADKIKKNIKNVKTWQKTYKKFFTSTDPPEQRARARRFAIVADLCQTIDSCPLDVCGSHWSSSRHTDAVLMMILCRSAIDDMLSRSAPRISSAPGRILHEDTTMHRRISRKQKLFQNCFLFFLFFLVFYLSGHSHPFPSPFSHFLSFLPLQLVFFLNPASGSGSLRWSPSRNCIWCILALKSDIW